MLLSLILLVTYKSFGYMCLVLLVLDCFPLFSSCIVLVSSCCITISDPIFFKTESSLIDLICCSTNNWTHCTKFIASSTPTSSASVELLVLIFCFIDIDIRAPCPNINTAQVWLLTSLCIVNDASTDHKSSLQKKLELWCAFTMDS